MIKMYMGFLVAFAASSFLWTTSVLYVVHSHGSSASMALAHRAYLQPRRRIEAIDETNAVRLAIMRARIRHARLADGAKPSLRGFVVSAVPVSDAHVATAVAVAVDAAPVAGAAPRSAFVSGPTFDGAVFQIGARITVEGPGRVFFDYLTISKEMLFERRHVRPDGVRPEWSKLKTWEEVASTARRCKSGGFTYPALSLSAEHSDSNVAHQTHVWRCHLAHIDHFAAAVAISLAFGDVAEPVDFRFSRGTLALGAAAWHDMSHYLIDKWRLPITVASGDPKKLVTLCGSMVTSSRGAHAVVDWVTHHLRLGADEIVLSLKLELQSKPVQLLIEKFKHLLADGTLKLWFVPAALNDVGAQADAVKLVFYQACLYHAKSTSRFVAAFDIDEWWLPMDLNSYLATSPGALADVLNNVASPSCEDWCFMVFPSVSIVPDYLWNATLVEIAPKPKHHRNPLDFTMTEDRQWTWKKSVVKSHSVTLLGFHTPGACTVDGRPRMLVAPYTKHGEHVFADEPCVVVGDKVGYMGHYKYSLRLPDPNTTALQPCPFSEFIAKHDHEKLLGAIQAL